MSVKQPSQELLDDLCSRFILNVPPEDLQSFERLLFVVEQAHWFYEDTSREQHTNLRSYSLRDFTSLLFQHCAALQPYHEQVHQIYDKFNAYKVKVPVAGAVIIDSTMQYCLLVKGWKASATWGFPKGKKSKDEEDSFCAIREVLEETGLDISPWLDPQQYLESAAVDRRCRLFFIAGIDMNTTQLRCQTKKEISEIGWHSLRDLVGAKAEGNTPVATKAASGARLYMVQPFVRQIVAWVAAHQSPQTRSLAAQYPAAAGKVITCWKARGEEASPSNEPYPSSAAAPTYSSSSAPTYPSSAAPTYPSTAAPTYPSTAAAPTYPSSAAAPTASLLGEGILPLQAPLVPQSILQRPAGAIPQVRIAPSLGPTSKTLQTQPKKAAAGEEAWSGMGLLGPSMQGLLSHKAPIQILKRAPDGPKPPTLDALGRPLYRSIREFKFDLGPILHALEFTA